MILKTGVNPFGIQPPLLLALIVADKIWNDLGRELFVTSLNDGEHSRTSLHYAGCAADLRTNYFDHNQKTLAANRLKNYLGNNLDYDIVVESDHIHIEYQPKYRNAL